MNCVKANERFIAMQVVQEHAEYDDDGGEFLPLSVWAQQGYNTAHLVDRCRPVDKKWHPVLGDTYRVSILKSGHRGSKGASKTDTLSAQPSTASSSGQLAIEDEDDSESSSTTSSASSSRKKSKKSKKTKKSKKVSKKQSKKEKKEKKAKELKRKREVEENKASVSSTAYVGNYC
jgi:hypothetical protein